MSETDHYKSLGIGPGATDHEIKNAYRRLMKECHPDALQRLPARQRAEAEEAARRANAAWETLSNAQRRLEYDQKRGYANQGLKKRDLIAAVRIAASGNDAGELFRTAQELYLHYPEDRKCRDLYAEACCALARQSMAEGNLDAAGQILRRAAHIAKDEELRSRTQASLKALKRLKRKSAQKKRNYLLDFARVKAWLGGTSKKNL